jgi:hypothetical protein
MKNILVIWGLNQYAYLSKYWLDICTDIININPQNYYFFSTISSKKLKSILNLSKFKGIINGQEAMTGNSWQAWFSFLDGIQEEYSFEEIYLFMAPLQANFSFGKEKNVISLYENIKVNDEFGNSFLAVKNLYRRLMLIYYLGKKIPITHFILDPIEQNWAKIFDTGKRFFHYDSERLECKHFPYAEYSFIYKNGIKEIPTKEYDFVFGMTSVMKTVDYRNEMIGKLLDLEKQFSDNKLVNKYFFKDKFRNINTYVTGKIYNNEYLLKSKYTLMIPAYDIEELSFVRFIEAIDRGVIPLVHEDCKYRKMLNHKDFIDLIEGENLLTSTARIVEKILTLDYKTIIKKLRDSNDYKRLLNIEYYRDYKNRLL